MQPLFFFILVFVHNTQYIMPFSGYYTGLEPPCDIVLGFPSCTLNSVYVENFIFKLFKFSINLLSFFNTIMMENKSMLYDWLKSFSSLCFSIILLAKKEKRSINCITFAVMNHSFKTGSRSRISYWGGPVHWWGRGAGLGTDIQSRHFLVKCMQKYKELGPTEKATWQGVPWIRQVFKLNICNVMFVMG